MSDEPNGLLTNHGVAILMKEMATRAINAIRAERFTFEAEVKLGKTGKMDDVVTSADRAAQTIYEKLIRENFPGYGIIAEENNLRVPCKRIGRYLYFTIDPLDGTKAFKRGQSHGVGTMIALVSGGGLLGNVLAAVVGDVNTREIFYYKEGSSNVWRVVPESTGYVSKLLVHDVTIPLSDQYILLREHPDDYSPGAKLIFARRKDKGVFRNIAMADGSIGISMARLWKNEVGACILKSEYDTPWDWNPVFGISRQLGYQFFEINPTTGQCMPTELGPLEEVTKRSQEFLVVHRSRLETFPYIY